MYKFLQRGGVLVVNYSDYQIDTLTRGDSKGSSLVRFDGIQWHFVEFGLTKILPNSYKLEKHAKRKMAKIINFVVSSGVSP